MVTATLGSRGQIIIPKSVRDALQLHEGSKVDFILTEDGEALLKRATREVKVDEVFGKLSKSRRKPVSVRQMKSGVRRNMKADSTRHLHPTSSN